MHAVTWRSVVTLSLLAALIVLPLAARGARADLIATVTAVNALAGAEGSAGVYAASSTALYQAGGAPYTSWDPRMAVTATITALSPDPGHPGTLVFAATQSSPYLSAVFRSDDGGRTAVMSTGAPGVTAFARPAGSSTIVYAAGSDQSTGYIYRSADAGLSWTAVYSAPSYSPGNAAVTALAVDRADPSHILAAVSVYHGGSMVESRDGGATWHGLPNPAATELMAPTALAINPTRSAEVWVAWGLMGYGLLAHSVDSGLHWSALTAGLPVSPFITAMAVDTVSHRVYVDVLGQGVPHRLYAARDGGRFEQFAPDATEIGLSLVVVSNTGYVVTGDDSHPLWARSIIGPLRWGVAAPFSRYYASVNAARLLGRPISPTTLCGAVLCQYFEKARLEDHGPAARPTMGPLTGDLLAVRAALPVGGATSTVTYASLAALAQPGLRVAPPAHFRGGVLSVNGGAFVPFSPTLGRSPGQIVAPYFWSYLSDSKVTPGGWMHDVGLPLTKVVAAVVSKGALGARRIYLQAFQNAILTYDPENAPAWRVERANIGVDFGTLFPGRAR